MNITPIQKNGWLELKVEGRLDAAWSEHFFNTVAAQVREGRHDIRVDASGLEYLSSAGMRAMLRARKSLTEVSGSFAVIRASDFVVQTLSMAGFSTLLALETEAEKQQEAANESDPLSEYGVAKWTKTGMDFERYELEEDAELDIDCTGSWKPWETVNPDSCRKIALGRDCIAVGTGAPGTTVAETREIMGDFISASGCTAWLPGTGADAPDYLLQEERFVPELVALTALRATGGFSHLLRFKPADEGTRKGRADTALPASGLLEAVLNATKSTAAAFVAVAEIEGLVGVSTLKSPCMAGPDDRPGEFPAIRDWLSFCGERVHAGSMALLVGFVDASASGRPMPHMPPLPSHEGWLSHIHAVVFPFHPLPNGKIFMPDTVEALFRGAEPSALLHLVEDHRPTLGLGQSAFIRGACWCAPAHFTVEEEAK